MNKNILHRILLNILIISMMMLAIVGCGTGDGQPSSDTEYIDPVEAEIDSIISGMTLNEKIYQLFVVTPEALTGAANVTGADELMRSSLAQFPVGGIIYFSNNLISPEQTKNMLFFTQELALEIEGVPLFLCVDEEGGRVSRINSNYAFGVEKIGAARDMQDAAEARSAGSVIGQYLAGLGFNFDFAPVADVLTVGGNTDIGNRSFGNDPDRVTELAAAFSDGLHEHNIMSSFKHFPGNGATAGNTHTGFASTGKTLEELYQTELKPFMAAQEKGVDSIMVGHISVPNIIGSDTPSSLSEYMVTEVLRNQLGYQGLAVTDALNMGAVANTYSPEQAAVMALKAGNDILLMPEDFHKAAEGIMAAVETGEISESRIDESVRRIIRAKVTAVGVPDASVAEVMVEIGNIVCLLVM